jgi:hypothetical protein
MPAATFSDAATFRADPSQFCLERFVIAFQRGYIDVGFGQTCIFVCYQPVASLAKVGKILP